MLCNPAAPEIMTIQTISETVSAQKTDFSIQCLCRLKKITSAITATIMMAIKDAWGAKKAIAAKPIVPKNNKITANTIATIVIFQKSFSAMITKLPKYKQVLKAY